eukprot:scaffold115092_cov55-Attheya_sp.AAC.3
MGAYEALCPNKQLESSPKCRECFERHHWTTRCTWGALRRRSSQRNFPWVVLRASTFFEANPASSAREFKEMQATLIDSVVLVGLQMTVISGSDDTNDKLSHKFRGTHLRDHLASFKSILSASHPRTRVLDDVVSIFISPTETCRKIQCMPVLVASGTVRDYLANPIGLQNK